MWLTRGLHVMEHVKQLGWCPAVSTPDGKRKLLLHVLLLPLLCCFCQHMALDNGWCCQMRWRAVGFITEEKTENMGPRWNAERTRWSCDRSEIALASLNSAFGNSMSHLLYSGNFEICQYLWLGSGRLSVRLSRWYRGICKWGAKIKRNPRRNRE